MFDAADRHIATINPDGVPTTSVYDAEGNISAVVDAVGRRTTVHYDAAGQPVAFEDGGGFRTSIGYDAEGHAHTLTTPRGQLLTYHFDAVGRPVERLNSAGGRISTVYDSAGQGVVLINELSHRTTFSFAPTGAKVREQDPLGRLRTWGFDAAGREVAAQDALGQVTTRAYDAADRLTMALYADGSRATLSYDARSLLQQLSDWTGIITQMFDARGHLARVTAPAHPGGAPLTYGFDGRGNRIRMEFGAETHQYLYDRIGRLHGYQDPDGGLATWLYDAASHPVEQVNPNGSATTWAYDARGLVSGVRHRTFASAELGAEGYAYDPATNLILRWTAQGMSTYGYAEKNQLTSEEDALGLVTTWTYDPAGNRIQQQRTQSGVATVTAYEYDPANGLTRCTEGGQVTTITTDANGSVVRESGSAGITTYTWDPRNQLSGYVAPSGQGSTFVNGFSGLRHRVEAGDGSSAVRMVWDPLGESGYTDLLAEVSLDGTMRREYWRGVHLVTLKQPDEKGVYLFDRQGNTQQVVSANAAELASYQHSAWGEVFGASGAWANQPFQYGGDWGAYRDPVSADLWMRQRVFDPKGGRFLSQDPIRFNEVAGRGLEGGDRSLYRYGLNRPWSFTDPSGESFAIVVPGIGVVTLAMAVELGIALGLLMCIARPDCRDDLGVAGQQLLDRIRDYFKAKCKPVPYPFTNDRPCSNAEWNECDDNCKMPNWNKKGIRRGRAWYCRVCYWTNGRQITYCGKMGGHPTNPLDWLWL